MLEIIENLEEETDGVTLKYIFEEKFGSGSHLNMNRALKTLREKEYVDWRQVGKKIYYKKKSNKYKNK